jgi:(p)ppGpp synthase/HD superfamily hydrolase
MQDVIDKIKDFADQAHGEQKRKYTPERYIVHPVRVMEICREYTTDISVLAAALLHDVLEDTVTTRDEIKEFLSTVMDVEKAERTVQLVEELTDEFIKENYPQWNRRRRKQKEAERLSRVSAQAQTIKYADIIDNSVEIVYQDTDFAQVYLFEVRAILKTMSKGDKHLYQRAIETIDRCIEELRNKR